MKQHATESRTYSVEAEKTNKAGSAGQSGDTQGLSTSVESGPESLRELAEEGQYLEADLVDGVESAEEPDVEEVHTRQFSEDDVPEEYINPD